MRSAVDLILDYNAAFPHRRLVTKLARLSRDPFTFLRGTFHVFAHDVREGPFRKWPTLGVRGPIVADLHTQNFGAYRAVTNEIVYDINDFDEHTEGPYELDLWRLATSLLLAAQQNGHTTGQACSAVEAMVLGYLRVLRGQVTRPRHAPLEDAAAEEIHRVLDRARARSRSTFLRTKVGVVTTRGTGFRLPHGGPEFGPVTSSERAAIVAALPRFLAHVLAPRGAHPERYLLLDVAARTAGVGSLGRARYALLLGKGEPGGERWSTLRLIEWKQALDSALDAPRPTATRQRAARVCAATQAFQRAPKRYLGHVDLQGLPMQAREIGANDRRFEPAVFRQPARLAAAAALFGALTARAHVRGAASAAQVREWSRAISARDERALIGNVLAFACAYAVRTLDDWSELRQRHAEVASTWRPR